MGPIILDSARRHDVTDTAMMHAIEHAINYMELDDGRLMVIGPDPAGRLLEVGVNPTGPRLIVFHAMPARPKYLDGGDPHGTTP